ncbi:MAG: hypothetical protein EDR02_16690 [Actinobacteria bacterium]|nr:MAG: hypothetical protein EDR02_16690 [Actinomycetota bacterium]RIK07486.1 MAG: hypothetical protein DCC48_03000 [Acidobacteriota bacterium]
MPHLGGLVLAALGATWLPVFVGPLLIVAYLTGSVIGWIGRADEDGVRSYSNALIAFEAAQALLIATLTWWLIEFISPPTSASAIGFLSSQVLTQWQSAALWAGAAAVTGQSYPLLGRWRGNSGIPAAGALVAVYAPTVLVAAVAGFGAGYLVTASTRQSVVGAFGGAVGFAWIAWSLEIESGWGVHNGPELALWVTVVAAVLYSRWRHPATRP